MHLFIIGILLPWLLGQSAARTDLLLVPLSSGKEVVDVVVRKIQSSRLFRDDREFLRRIASVETSFGLSPFNAPGGIWALSEDNFAATQNDGAFPALRDFYPEIQKHWNINWKSVTFGDLTKPFLSGLAARLYLVTKTEPIPGTINKQALFWKKHYNFDAASTYATFVTKVSKWEANRCRGKMDICIMMDGSGSVGAANFERERRFVSNMMATFGNGTVRAAVVVYNESATVVLSLGSTLEWGAKRILVERMPYPDGNTETKTAIRACVAEYSANPGEPSVPKVNVVLTDGQSNSPVDQAASEAHNAGITSFAVGVGPDINGTELVTVANGDESRVYGVNDFLELAEFFGRLSEVTCEVPQTPKLGKSVRDVLGKKRDRNYKYPVPKEGLVVIVDTKEGVVKTYYSYTFENPSEAFNDGEIHGTAVVPFPESGYSTRFKRGLSGDESSNSTVTVWIKVVGQDDQNDFILKAEPAQPHNASSSAQEFTVGFSSRLSSWLAAEFFVAYCVVCKFLQL